MSALSGLWADWFPSPKPPNPLAQAVANARTLLAVAAAAGRSVPAATSQPILDMSAATDAGTASPVLERGFYAAVTDLAAITADLSKRVRSKREHPFEEAVEAAELLLKHAAEAGTPMEGSIADDILHARTALKNNSLDDAQRAAFYRAYAALSKMFGTVTAETIRHCTSTRTGRKLKANGHRAVALTLVVAFVSVVTFVADSNLKTIDADIAGANDLAAKLRLSLTASPDAPIPSSLTKDPCGVSDHPGDKVQPPRTLGEISQLQDFAATIRAVENRTLKLNTVVRWTTLGGVRECDPFDAKCSDTGRASLDPAKLQINPAIPDYPAEILCRISTYQEIRTFATNVVDDYTSIVGAVTSYALPILYALLGAYAYRLRQFADTVQQRTYHPSFTDTARMITAVIAGAICGLFNPAQGLALSPLAVAFLVGYGVELFFKMLDALGTSFGMGGKAGR